MLSSSKTWWLTLPKPLKVLLVVADMVTVTPVPVPTALKVPKVPVPKDIAPTAPLQQMPLPNNH